jgi:hypothetical protein
MPLSHDGPKSLAANLQFAFFNLHFAMHCASLLLPSAQADGADLNSPPALAFQICQLLLYVPGAQIHTLRALRSA